MYGALQDAYREAYVFALRALFWSRGSTEGGGGGGGKGATAGEEGEDKEAELERRRQDRAAQIAAK